jgi:hypothetical protein
MNSQPRLQVIPSGFWVLTVVTLFFSLISFSPQAYGGSRSLRQGPTTEWVDQRLYSTRPASYFQRPLVFASVGAHHDAFMLRSVGLIEHLHFLQQQKVFQSIKINLLKQLLFSRHSQVPAYRAHP